MPVPSKLVAGRERIFLDRFWNEFASDPPKIDEATREHYAELYALPGALHSDFAQFRSIRQDAEDNMASMPMKLTMPVLTIGGDKSFGANEALVMRNTALSVTELPAEFRPPAHGGAASCHNCRHPLFPLVQMNDNPGSHFRSPNRSLAASGTSLTIWRLSGVVRC